MLQLNISSHISSSSHSKANEISWENCPKMSRTSTRFILEIDWTFFISFLIHSCVIEQSLEKERNSKDSGPVDKRKVKIYANQISDIFFFREKKKKRRVKWNFFKTQIYGFFYHYEQIGSLKLQLGCLARSLLSRSAELRKWWEEIIKKRKKISPA